jgi:hypothetical protein
MLYSQLSTHERRHVDEEDTCRTVSGVEMVILA